MGAERGLLKMETGKTPLGITLLADLGDHQTFGASGVDLLSAMALTDVRPNGVVAGVNMVSPAATGTNNLVDVAAIVCMLLGSKVAVAAATDVSVTRPATNVAKINSITVTSAGAIAVVAGTDSLSSAFSATRAAAGGPPLIPVDSIELAQVKLVTSTAAAITAAQIVHTTEFAESFEINETGLGDHSELALRRRAHVYFGRVLPLIHTGPAARRVYADLAEPQMTIIAETKDFKPAEITASVTSEEFYNIVRGGFSQSLGAAGFKTRLVDGVSDLILASRGKVRTFQFYSDRDQTAHLVTQGMVAAARTFPVAGSITADVVIAAPRASVEYFID